MAHVPRRQALLLREWDRWTIRRGITTATAREVLNFYVELQTAQSPLLKFNARGRDKWQILYRWLLSSGRLIE
jgi:hypothetical protein